MRKIIISMLFIFVLWSAGCMATLPQTGGSIAWPEQLAAATRVAHAVNSDATLLDIQATTDYFGPKGSLRIRFLFVQSSGGLIEVIANDIRREASIENSGGSITKTPNQAERTRLDAALAGVDISPALALAAARPAGEAFIHRFPTAIFGSVELNRTTTLYVRYGTAAAWSVSYATATDSIYIWIDATTGALLGTTNEPLVEHS